MLNLDTLEKISATTKRLEKEALLKELNDHTKELVRWSLEPLITFGVTVNEEEVTSKYIGGASEPIWLANFNKLLEDLSTRSLTGNNAIHGVNYLLTMAPTKEHCRWGCRVLNKDLRAGIQVKTVTKIFPGLIKEFLVALATEFDPDKHLPLEGDWIVEPKLDGLRMVIYKGKAYTRSGILLTSVDHIIEQLGKDIDLNQYVFDGEVMGDAADFDSASGKVRQQQGTNEGNIYHIFDVIEAPEWDNKETKPLSYRKDVLLGMLCCYGNSKTGEYSKNIRVVPWDVIQNPNFTDLEKIRDFHINNKFEGAMIKDPKASYMFKRSDKLLKLKTFNDLDGEIIGVFEGKGKHKGRLGGLKVVHDGDVVTEVGSGFNDAQREEFWANQENLIGKTVTIKYQNKTKYGTLRFPVFQKIRIDK